MRLVFQQRKKKVALSSTTRSATSEPSAAFRRTRPVQPRRLPSSEKALEVMGECQGPAVEALKAEVEKNQGCGEATSNQCEVEECRKFIHHKNAFKSERAKAVTLKEAKDRFQLLEVEQAQQPDPNAHPASVPETSTEGCRHWLPSLQSQFVQVAGPMTVAFPVPSALDCGEDFVPSCVVTVNKTSRQQPRQAGRMRWGESPS